MQGYLNLPLVMFSQAEAEAAIDSLSGDEYDTLLVLCQSDEQETQPRDNLPEQGMSHVA